MQAIKLKKAHPETALSEKVAQMMSQIEMKVTILYFKGIAFIWTMVYI